MFPDRNKQTRNRKQKKNWDFLCICKYLYTLYTCIYENQPKPPTHKNPQTMESILGIPHKRAVRSTFSCNIWFWSSNMCLWSSKANMSSFMAISCCCSLAIFSDLSLELAWWVDGKMGRWRHASPQKVARQGCPTKKSHGIFWRIDFGNCKWDSVLKPWKWLLPFKGAYTYICICSPKTVLFWNSSSAHPSNLKKSRHVFYMFAGIHLEKSRFREITKVPALQRNVPGAYCDTIING